MFAIEYYIIYKQQRADIALCLFQHKNTKIILFLITGGAADAGTKAI